MTQAPAAQSALQDTYKKHGAVLETRANWQTPLHFGSPDSEVNAAKNAVAIGELVGAGVVEIIGNDLAKFAEKLKVGKIHPGETTSIKVEGAKDARWAQLTRSQARILVGPGESAAVLAALKTEGCQHAADLTSGLSTFVLTGPKALDVLARMVRLDLDPNLFVDKKLALTGAAGIPLQIIRWDRGGAAVYELTVGRDLGEYFWDSVSHAGEDLGLKHIGATGLAQLGVIS